MKPAKQIITKANFTVIHHKKLIVVGISFVLFAFYSCCSKNNISQNKNLTPMGTYISQQQQKDLIQQLINKFGSQHAVRIEKGVLQTANLWMEKDGSYDVFTKFCVDNFISDDSLLKSNFNKLSRNFESVWGNLLKLNLDLREPLDLDQGEILPIDMLFGSYNPAAHIEDDFYDNKIAFFIILNYPSYNLTDKLALGKNWNALQWAYARMGDVYISRVPAALKQQYSEIATAADSYISDYNIYMGKLVNDKNEKLFPEDMKLITHWGLRDEIKSNYNAERGLEKQQIIYQVMLRIINQEIPENVINKGQYSWNPLINKLYDGSKEVEFKPENNLRYQHLLNLFQITRKIDAYNPQYPNYIARKFESDMEIPQAEVEAMFRKYVSSPQVKAVAQLISKRLGRALQPFDIWYDGFKQRAAINQDELDKIVRQKYPDRDAFQKDLPFILERLGFVRSEAIRITDKIQVDASRGAGHAWGAEMRTDKAHLRTRIGKNGMNYKGYNIAVHEFGHNVEQTITLHDVEHYLLKGVPNTSFTEALAFVFQKRDLELLGIKNNNPDVAYYQTLDIFWGTYEIMGVSLVDMQVWKWLYENPNATAAQLKEEVIKIAKQVWNEYYADVFGVKDQIILAVYSHMIDNPLYLSAYPIGHIIEFQLEQHLAKIKASQKNAYSNAWFAEEVQRIFSYGRRTPDAWMQHAVGQNLSIQPMLTATTEALNKLEK